MFASGDQRIVVTAPRFSPDGARVSLLGQHRSPAAFAPSMGKGSTVLELEPSCKAAEEEPACRAACLRAYEEERKKARPTIDELKAKYDPTWGIAQPVDEPAVREATTRRLAEINERGLLAEYAAAGLEPQRTSDGTLLSLSLLRSVREHERRIR